MEILSEFSATETFLLLGRSNTDLKYMLRYGLLDLLLNRVLKISIEEFQDHPNDPIVQFCFIRPGSKFSTYQPLPHDEVFLSPFTQFKKERILLSKLVRAALDAAKNEKSFIKSYVRKSPMITSKFKDNWFFRLFKIHKLNHRGREMQHFMKTELRQLEIDLPDLVKSDPRKTLEIFLRIKANLFLLRNASTTIVPKIKPHFFTEIKKAFPNETIDFGEKDYYWDLLTIYPQFLLQLDRLIASISRTIREDEGVSSLFYGDDTDYGETWFSPWWLFG